MKLAEELVRKMPLVKELVIDYAVEIPKINFQVYSSIQVLKVKCFDEEIMDLRTLSNLEELVLIDISTDFILSAITVTSKIQKLRIFVPEESYWDEDDDEDSEYDYKDDYNEQIHENLVYIRKICKCLVVSFEEEEMLHKFNHSDYEN